MSRERHASRRRFLGACAALAGSTLLPGQAGAMPGSGGLALRPGVVNRPIRQLEDWENSVALNLDQGRFDAAYQELGFMGRTLKEQVGPPPGVHAASFLQQRDRYLLLLRDLRDAAWNRDYSGCQRQALAFDREFARFVGGYFPANMLYEIDHSTTIAFELVQTRRWGCLSGYLCVHLDNFLRALRPVGSSQGFRVSVERLVVTEQRFATVCGQRSYQSSYQVIQTFQSEYQSFARSYFPQFVV